MFFWEKKNLQRRQWVTLNDVLGFFFERLPWIYLIAEKQMLCSLTRTCCMWERRQQALKDKEVISRRARTFWFIRGPIKGTSSLHQRVMQLYDLCRLHLRHRVSVIHLLPLWRTWSNNLCNKHTKYSYYDTMRTIDQRPSSSQKSKTHSLPAFRRESNNPPYKKKKKNRSESPGFRFPAPLSGPAGSLAWAHLAALSATAAVRVEQLCMWAPTLSAARAEWWHRPAALSATEGPFVSRGTRASYTQHNDTVHSPPSVMRGRV